MSHAKFLLKNLPISLIKKVLIKLCRLGGGAIPTISAFAWSAFFPTQDALRLELSESYSLLPEISQTLPDRSFMVIKIQQTVPVTSFPRLTGGSHE